MNVEPVRYFHGGVPHKSAGFLLLPPATTGARSTADYGSGRVTRRDRVYVVTDVAGALICASLHPSGQGCIYEVEPIGDLEPDPDCTQPGLSFACPSARVLRRIPLDNQTRRTIREELIRDDTFTALAVRHASRMTGLLPLAAGALIAGALGSHPNRRRRR